MTYYGDDFTGSTDVLEALHRGGIEAVLFVEPPSEEMLRRYAHVRAFGIAGNSRTMSPQEMDRTLPEVFRILQRYQPRIVHYKVCSTFDSSPDIGSIGRAIDIGHSIFQNRIVPVVVGAPPLRRYCVFGNLFAKSGLSSVPFRLDRHPTMQCHPVTPMAEADLCVHLSRQTPRAIRLIDVLTLDNDYDIALDQLDLVEPPGSAVLFDALTDEHLATIGRLILDVQQSEQKPLFVAGSSGIEYALTTHWQSAGIGDRAKSNVSTPASSPMEHTVVLSGSCSPVTDRQIGWALDHGFDEVAIDIRTLCRSKRLDTEICEVARQIISSLDSGQSVIAHTSRGPADSRIIVSNDEIGVPADCDREIGTILGQVMREVLRVRSVKRIAVVGGDTAGQVARSLEIEAVEMIGPIQPGAPLCLVRSRNSAVDGLEISFKGGQVGYDDFFGALLRGRTSSSSIGVGR